MVPDVSTGSYTAGLLYYLFGKGRRDEHTDPHIVAAWDLAGAPDPGRDPDATIGRLADRLDLHARLRAKETGKMPAKHVWHCPVRTAPGDRYLTDAEWAEVARRIVVATGIAPDGDDMACRWIAVRHAEDHIHIAAVSVRADGRRARTNRDGWRAQKECRQIEKEYGLRQLKSGDLTAPKIPTSAEQAKAERMGRSVTSREWLREQAYGVLAAVRTEQEFFDVLGALGIKAKKRLGPRTGQVTGYSLAAPGDTNAQGDPVYFSGSKLAPRPVHRPHPRDPHQPRPAPESKVPAALPGHLAPGGQRPARDSHRPGRRRRRGSPGPTGRHQHSHTQHSAGCTAGQPGRAPGRRDCLQSRSPLGDPRRPPESNRPA
jgi:hypothetical protein